MIDEKKLIDYLRVEARMDRSKAYGERECEVIEDTIRMCIDIVKAFPKAGGWIPVSERLPENETEVEISCIRRYTGAGDEKKECLFTARAFYTDGTMTTEDSSFVWDDCDNWEYDEEKDAYIIPEGWWECVSFSEEFGIVDAEVLAWMPLPSPYKEEGAE